MMPIWMINIIKILGTIEFMFVSINLILLFNDALYNHKIIKFTVIFIIASLSTIPLYMIYTLGG